MRDRLTKKLRIYIVPYSAKGAMDWMEVHEFLRPGWRDPRVSVLMTAEEVLGVSESVDNEFIFLEGWTRGRSPQFRQAIWNRLPHVMQRNRIV